MCPILVYVAQFELQVFVGVFENINSYHHSNYIFFKTQILLHTQKKWIVLFKKCNPNPNTSITKQSLVWHLTLWKLYFSCYNILNKMTKITTNPMWLIWVLFFHLVNVLFDWLLKKTDCLLWESSFMIPIKFNAIYYGWSIQHLHVDIVAIVLWLEHDIPNVIWTTICTQVPRYVIFLVFLLHVPSLYFSLFVFQKLTQSILYDSHATILTLFIYTWWEISCKKSLCNPTINFHLRSLFCI